MVGRRPLLLVGLTGGIASGKSTVAAFLSELGALVIDADLLARSVMEPGAPAYRAVVERFGSEILDERGRIERPALARMIFDDEVSRLALNAIVHPQVRAEMQRVTDGYAAEPGSPIVIYDAALLVETGAYRDFDRLIVVRCSRATQIRRLAKRDGLSKHEAELRIDAQAPIQRKLEVADYVVDTEASLEQTRVCVEAIHTALLEEFQMRQHVGGQPPIAE